MSEKEPTKIKVHYQTATGEMATLSLTMRKDRETVKNAAIGLVPFRGTIDRWEEVDPEEKAHE